VLLRNATDQNLQPAQEALARSHQQELRVEESVEGKHEAPAAGKASTGEVPRSHTMAAIRTTVLDHCQREV
jgi:hypothetical protein